MTLDDFDPDVAIYDLYLDEVHIAKLYEPRFEEMFWCSYRVEAVSDEGDAIVHDETLWQGVDVKVFDAEGNEPGALIAAIPSCEDFCARETDRMMFRSLWPPQPPQPPTLLKPFSRLVRWIKSCFESAKSSRE